MLQIHAVQMYLLKLLMIKNHNYPVTYYFILTYIFKLLMYLCVLNVFDYE